MSTFYSQHQASNSPASGVSSVNGITGALTLVAGSNITITPSGNNITIASTGGGGTPAGSTGAIQFNNASAFGADTANFFWDNTNKSLLIGTNSQPSGATGTPLYFVSQNATSANGFQYIEYYQTNANGSGIAIRKARGTLSSPVHINNGDTLGNITFNGYSTTGGFGGGVAAILASAGEDFNSTSSRGASLTIQTTPVGSGSRLSSLTTLPGSLFLYDVGGTNRIRMNVPTSTNYTMSLPPSLPVSGSAFWTIGTGGSGNFTGLSGDAASTGAQGAVTVTGLQGNAVDSTTPTNNQVLLYQVGPIKWVPTTLGGDLSPSNTVGAFTITKLQGITLTAHTPSSGDVLKYNGTAWVNSPASGGGGSVGSANTFQLADGSGGFLAATGITYSTPGGSAYQINWNGGAVNILADTSAMIVTAPGGVHFSNGILVEGSGVVYGPSTTPLQLRSQAGAGNVQVFTGGPGNNLEITSGNGVQFDDTTTNNVVIKAPTTVSASYTMKLPAAQGTGAILNDGSGNLSFQSGFTGTVSPVNSITVVNGIVTAVS